MASGKREEKFLQSNGSVGSFDSFGLSLANNGGAKHSKKSHVMANSVHSMANSKRSASGGRVLAASQERRSVRDGHN